MSSAFDRKGSVLATAINTELSAVRAKLLSVLQATADAFGLRHR
ncbi:hypothetical protein [Methylomicrobium album]|nr:hypothetical protein [Methylomicrobium album]